MKKVRTVSFVLLVLTVAVMAIDRFAAPVPDWAVRTAGVVMLLALAGTAYSIVRGSMEQ